MPLLVTFITLSIECTQHKFFTFTASVQFIVISGTCLPVEPFHRFFQILGTNFRFILAAIFTYLIFMFVFLTYSLSSCSASFSQFQNCLLILLFVFSCFSSQQSPNNGPTHYTSKYVGRLQCFPVLDFVLGKIVRLFYCFATLIIPNFLAVSSHPTSCQFISLHAFQSYQLLSFLSFLSDTPTAVTHRGDTPWPCNVIRKD